ncbi:MAG: DUF1232 domain-containing protein [Peptoniphilus sp.]|nr:DUF1232 domain-containing protein [Peptoniphilus sp.]
MFRWSKVLRRKMPLAKKVLSDPSRVKKLVEDSFSLLKKKGQLSAVEKEGLLLASMVKDTVTGRYRGLKKRNLLLIVCGLLYLVNPMDLLPDFIFAIGFADDLGVFMYVISKVRGEIDAYRSWREGEVRPAPYGETVEEAPDLSGYEVIHYDE